jgi:NTP pyrophosphatase (non-canonical NTP hydrolase)
MKRIIQFRDERDWSKFHKIKDLCLGLGIEVAELQEIFLWKTNKQLVETVANDKDKIADELADIFIFLAYISHDLEINLGSAINRKIDKNSEKYPIAKAKGSNKKYDQL